MERMEQNNNKSIKEKDWIEMLAHFGILLSVNILNKLCKFIIWSWNLLQQGSVACVLINMMDAQKKTSIFLSFQCYFINS